MMATLNSISPLVELRVLSAAPPILYSLKQHFHGGPNGPSKDRRKDPNKRSNYGSKANAYQNVHCSSLDLTEDKDIDRKGPAQIEAYLLSFILPPHRCKSVGIKTMAPSAAAVMPTISPIKRVVIQRIAHWVAMVEAAINPNALSSSNIFNIFSHLPFSSGSFLI